MRKIFLVFIFSLFFTENLLSKEYRVGEEIQNQVMLDKTLKIELSPGTWTIIEEDFWDYAPFSGKYISLAKIKNNEISEIYSLSYLDTFGKYISDVNSWLHKVIYKNKYDGCYKRPEYYILELFNKGSTTNCLIIRHIDPNKELYNPDDKELAYLDAPLIRWIEDNSIKVPDVMLQSNHLIFVRTSSPKLYIVNYEINPEFFKGPINKFTTEDDSEYHPNNIKKYKKHEKFMNDFIKKASAIHIELENKIKLKQYQKLELAKYSPESKSIITKKSKKNEISNEDIKRLKELKKLLDNGILTQEEFNTQKKKILN